MPSLNVAKVNTIATNAATECGTITKQFKTTIRYPSQPKPEIGWVLVKDDPGYGLAYLSIRYGLWYWSHNNLDALRMARKEDAEALKTIFPTGRAEEHQWG